MKLDFNRIFQAFSLAVMIYVVLILNTMYHGNPLGAQTSATSPEVPSFPVKITNLEQFSPKYISSFPVNKENQFVVVDGQNRTIMFYEIVWNGPTPTITIKAHTAF